MSFGSDSALPTKGNNIPLFSFKAKLQPFFPPSDGQTRKDFWACTRAFSSSSDFHSSTWILHRHSLYPNKMNQLSIISKTVFWLAHLLQNQCSNLIPFFQTSHFDGSFSHGSRKSLDKKLHKLLSPELAGNTIVCRNCATQEHGKCTTQTLGLQMRTPVLPYAFSKFQTAPHNPLQAWLHMAFVALKK